MTDEDLARLVAALRERCGDTAAVEVKAAAGGTPRLVETLCAFANMPDGGTIVLGLDERREFKPVGLEGIAELEAGIASQARGEVAPPPQLSFSTNTIEGSQVLVVQVAGLPLHDRPAMAGGKAYLRQSDGDYVMSDQEIGQIELLKTQAKHPTHPDRQPVPGMTVADLDPELLAAYMFNVRQSSRRYRSLDDEKLLRYTNVTASDGTVTLAGLYAMGIAPQIASPSLGVTAAVRLGNGADERVQDLVHLSGPIPDLLEDTMNWVRRTAHTVMGYDTQGHGVDRDEFPLRAVRELVANALVHRNRDPITDSKRVEIRLIDGRLVIASPGGLWGVSESQLGTPEGKSAVNPVLYEICKHVRMPDGSRVIEGEGGGIREANEALAAAGFAPVHFRDQTIRMTAIVERNSTRPRNRRAAPLASTKPPVRDVVPSSTKNGAVVLGALSEPRTFDELCELTGLSTGQVRYALRVLMAGGAVVMDGAQGDRGTQYRKVVDAGLA